MMTPMPDSSANKHLLGTGPLGQGRWFRKPTSRSMSCRALPLYFTAAHRFLLRDRGPNL